MKTNFDQLRKYPLLVSECKKNKALIFHNYYLQELLYSLEIDKQFLPLQLQYN